MALEYQAEHNHHEYETIKLTISDHVGEPKVTIRVDDQRVTLTFDELADIHETFKQFFEAKQAMAND